MREVVGIFCGVSTVPHIFHRSCLDEWLELSKICPVCRYDLVRADGTDYRVARRFRVDGVLVYQDNYNLWRRRGFEVNGLAYACERPVGTFVCLACLGLAAAYVRLFLL